MKKGVSVVIAKLLLLYSLNMSRQVGHFIFQLLKILLIDRRFHDEWSIISLKICAPLKPIDLAPANHPKS